MKILNWGDMRMIKKLKTKKINDPGHDTGSNDEEIVQGDDPKKLSQSFNDNVESLRAAFTDCPDIIMRNVSLSGGKTGYFVYVDGLVNTDLIQRDFIGPLLCMDYEKLVNDDNPGSLPVAGLKLTDDIKMIIDDVLMGNTVFIGEGLKYAMSCSLIEFDERSIEEPETEKNIKGPHEGFVESIKTNMTMLRRHIKNNSLKFKMFRIGTTSNQPCAIAYIDGIADPKLLDQLSEKIRNLNFDAFLGVGYIEQLIMDHPNSPFPQYLSTERPDRVIGALTEGRLAIMLDGTPFVSIVPAGFFTFFKSVDDYTTNWMFGTFIGTIRLLAALIAIFLPGLYISVLTFHYYTVPLSLLITLAESRARVPFHPLIEALLMEITLELLREATIRLPTYISNSIGVVGGIIIGNAAVQAGLVSNLMVIVVAITGIASFVIPSYDMGLALRWIRFIVMLLAAAFGALGIVTATAIILVHLLALESLGQPYFQPVIPLKSKDLKDAGVRLPIKFLETDRKSVV